MSKFSGKCDLCDTISGMGGWYDRDGNPAKIGDGVGALYSDELQDFIVFKKKTKGIIYQHLPIKVTLFNQDLVADKNEHFKVITHIKEIPDKRYKSGKREKKYFTYEYFGKEYKTLTKLNKENISITKEIHFETLLDIIPYYPYITSSICSTADSMTVFITEQSYIDIQEASLLQYGYFSTVWNHYRELLQDHYRKVVLNYFNPTGREHVEKVFFDKNTRQGKVKYNIDTNFPVEWNFIRPSGYWTCPKIIKDNIIEISEPDLEVFLGQGVEVKYVSAYDNSPIILH